MVGQIIPYVLYGIICPTISKNTMAGLLKFYPKLGLFWLWQRAYLHREASYYGEEEIILVLILFHLVLQLLLF